MQPARRLLHFRDRVQRDGRFTGRFRSVYFYNSSARKPAYAKRDIKRERAAWDRLHLHVSRFPELHDRSFSELFLDITQCRFQCRTTIRQLVHFLYIIDVITLS
jgi:hypothetical protein